MIDEDLIVSTCLDLPPPVARRHLTVHPVVQILILIVFFRSVLHPIPERRIPNQLSYTFDWVPSPELDFLDNGITIFVLAVSGDFEDFTYPLWSLGEAIDFLKECMFVL